MTPALLYPIQILKTPRIKKEVNKCSRTNQVPDIFCSKKLLVLYNKGMIHSPKIVRIKQISFRELTISLPILSQLRIFSPFIPLHLYRMKIISFTLINRTRLKNITMKRRFMTTIIILINHIWWKFIHKMITFNLLHVTTLSFEIESF